MIHMFFTKSISSVITLKSVMSVRHWHFGDRNRPEFCFRIWSKCIVPVIGYILQKENHIFLISGKTYSKNFLGVFFLHVLCFLPNFHSDVDTITHHDKIYTFSRGQGWCNLHTTNHVNPCFFLHNRSKLKSPFVAAVVPGCQALVSVVR